MGVNRNPPFRADHVGSMLRPREVLEARASLEELTLVRHALESLDPQSRFRVVA